MNVCRSGTGECSAASARASSSVGRISNWSATTGIQDLVGVGQRQVARCQEQAQVVEDVGRFLGHALVGFLTRGTRDLFSFLLHFVAYQRRVGEELGRPAA